jgi:hypothetical protein
MRDWSFSAGIISISSSGLRFDYNRGFPMISTNIVGTSEFSDSDSFFTFYTALSEK